MGWKDIFSNASEWDLNDLLQGGILGASMKAQARRISEERSSRPKPAKYCNPVCIIDDDRCTPCLTLQRELEQNLTLLERMEETLELNTDQIEQMMHDKKITKCSLCGAPYKEGGRECPYCGTAYPLNGIPFDIPLSKHERQEQIMQQAGVTWDICLKFFVLRNQYIQDTAGTDMMGYLQKFVGKAANAMQSYMNLTPLEIQQGAQYYHVTMSQHIYGVMMGEMKTIKLIRLETQYQ